jgi:hypothetical protein
MAQVDDYTDYTIRWGEPGVAGNAHPKYNDEQIVETSVIEVIVQKLEMILYSNKGDVWGVPDLGCDLEFYLWKTNISNDNLREIIIDQIDLFVPELNIIGFELNLELYEGVVRDILYINITIYGYNITYIFD